MVFERKLKGGLHGYANYENSYWPWIHLIDQTCPSWPVPVKKKSILNYLIISDICCLYSRDGGDEGDRTPYLNAASVALYQMSYVPNCGNFVVQGFPADNFQFKNSVLGKSYQGLEAWLEKFSDGVPKGSRTPVAAVKGRSPRPLDDGDN